MICFIKKKNRCVYKLLFNYWNDSFFLLPIRNYNIVIIICFIFQIKCVEIQYSYTKTFWPETVTTLVLIKNYGQFSYSSRWCGGVRGWLHQSHGYVHTFSLKTKTERSIICCISICLCSLLTSILCLYIESCFSVQSLVTNQHFFKDKI